MRYLHCEVECLRTERKIALQEKLMIYRDKSMVGTMFSLKDPNIKNIKGVHESTVQQSNLLDYSECRKQEYQNWIRVKISSKEALGTVFY